MNLIVPYILSIVWARTDDKQFSRLSRYNPTTQQQRSVILPLTLHSASLAVSARHVILCGYMRAVVTRRAGVVGL